MMGRAMLRNEAEVPTPPMQLYDDTGVGLHVALSSLLG
jgi:hypothetical protein